MDRKRIAEVRDLLASGDGKAALKEARRLHKCAGTPEIAALVIEVAVARARSLLHRGLGHEARSLLDLVCGEHRDLESERALEIAELLAMAGDPAALVAPLADPQLEPERRRRIERAIARAVADPAALAACRTLADDHSLRRSAAGVANAMQQVTSGATVAEPPALAEVPRRGPLAAWKLLVRAIRAACRGDAPGCEACLASMDPESAPATLVPLLRALAGRDRTNLPPGPAAELWARLHPDQLVDLATAPPLLLRRILGVSAATKASGPVSRCAPSPSSHRG